MEDIQEELEEEDEEEDEEAEELEDDEDGGDSEDSSQSSPALALSHLTFDCRFRSEATIVQDGKVSQAHEEFTARCRLQGCNVSRF